MIKSFNSTRLSLKLLLGNYELTKLTNSRLLNNTVSALVKKVDVLDKETVRILFSDDNYCDFKNIWLRDSCKCEKCVDKITQHKLFEIPYTDIQPRVSSVRIDSSTGHLNIEWRGSVDKHISTYQAGWLYQFVPIFNETYNGKKLRISDPFYKSPLPSGELWNREQIQVLDLNTDYREFMDAKRGLKTVLGNIHKYGIALIKGAPAKQSEVFKIVERMGQLMETGYGKSFQIRINPHPKTHLTYTGRRFEFHTDLSYMRNSPTMQLLHCIKADTVDSEENSAGGISFFSDAFKVIEWLRTTHPEHFEILTTAKVNLSYLDAQRNRWFRAERTLIKVNQFNEVTEFFCSDFSLRSPILPLNKIIPFYAAYHCLMKKMNTDEYVWKFFLKKGDVVIFNNFRVLHGRDHYDPSKIDRHLEGAYMDLQEAISLYENLLE